MLENDLHIFVEILLCIWCVISITSKVCNCNFSFQLRLLALKVAKIVIRYNAIHGGLNYVFRLRSVNRNLMCLCFLLLSWWTMKYSSISYCYRSDLRYWDNLGATSQFIIHCATCSTLLLFFHRHPLGRWMFPDRPLPVSSNCATAPWLSWGWP